MKLTTKKPLQKQTPAADLDAEAVSVQFKKPSVSTPKPKPANQAKIGSESASVGESRAATGYLIQCAPGLAKTTQKELNFVGATSRDHKFFTKLQRNHDLLFTNSAKSEDGMAKLRTAEMVLRCPAFGRFKISQRQLGIMAEELKAKGPRRLVVSVAGKNFQRQDLARFLTKAMSERGYEFDDEIEDEVWMFCIDESWYFGLPLFKARTQREDSRSEERAGSLPPTIAAALAFAAMPKDDDLVLDPTCGSGTLLSELRPFAPGASLIGCDIDKNAVRIASQNLSLSSETLPETSKAPVFIHGDSRDLETLLGQSDANESVGKISLVVSNLPFGVQFGDRASNPELYRALFESCAKVADRNRNWRGLFLTSDTESFEQALRKTSVFTQPEVMFKVKIRGELATCYRVRLS